MAAARRSCRRRAREVRSRAASPTRSTRTILDRYDLVDRNLALRAIHRPESMAELEAAKRRLVFDEFLRMQVGLVARKRALAAEQSGIAHVVDGAARRRVPRATCRSRSPATSSARSTRSRATWRARRRCTACCRATSVRARPSSRSRRCSSACRAATRARSWRRPRCSPSSTTSASVAVARRAHGRRPTGSLLGERPGARRAAHEPHDRGRAPADRARRSQRNEVDILVGTHALLYGDAEFTQPRRAR